MQANEGPEEMYQRFADRFKKEQQAEASMLQPPFKPEMGLNWGEKNVVRKAFDTFGARDLAEAASVVATAYETSIDSAQRHLFDMVHRCLRAAHLTSRGMRAPEAIRTAESALSTRDMVITEARSAEARTADYAEIRRIAARWVEAL